MDTTSPSGLDPLSITASASTDTFLIDPKTITWFYGSTMATAFEHQRSKAKDFAVDVDAKVSQTLIVSAETPEEAKLKARLAAREIFERDLFVQPRE